MPSQENGKTPINFDDSRDSTSSHHIRSLSTLWHSEILPWEAASREFSSA